jgi:hypothetical protein
MIHVVRVAARADRTHVASIVQNIHTKTYASPTHPDGIALRAQLLSRQRSSGAIVQLPRDRACQNHKR